MNSKPLRFLIAGLVLFAIGFALTKIQDPSRCQEKVFQDSAVFGTSPRRFFEMTAMKAESPTEAFFGPVRYILSFYCNPLLVIEASRFTCTTKQTTEVTESEKEAIRKQIFCDK